MFTNFLSASKRFIERNTDKVRNSHTISIYHIMVMDDILAKAEQIAIKHKVEFVGSEHLLMAMLVSNNQFTDWLNQENISKQTISALEKVLKEIIVLKNTCEQSESGQQHDHSDYENLETPGFLMRSPCLTRTISIISSIQSGNFSAGIQ